jgi:alkylation response protein AidB-like acyl-CoA dehydrogenase
LACDLNHDEDQRQILDAARAMLTTTFPLSRLREDRRDDLAPVVEFGVFGLALPEAHGGSGFSLVEEALVHVLFGRHLVTTRALATAVAAIVARELGKTEIADGLVAGERAACAAVAVDDDMLMIDVAQADYATVFGPHGIVLADLEGVECRQSTGLGHSIPVARAPREHMTAIGETGSARTLAIADLLVSAQLLGVAEAARDLAVDYARVRQQFGKPIGAFQAIKHHCSNMAIAAEMLSAQLDMAAIAARDGREDAVFQVAVLRRLASRTAFANARTCIQIHGGIGFSAEADAHHVLKQAHVLSRFRTGAPMLDLAAPMAPHLPPHQGG